MDKKLRKNLLQQLSLTKNEKTDSAILDEFKRIEFLLQSETRYDLLEECIEYLSVIAIRLPDRSFELIRNYLTQIETINITYQPILGIPEYDFAKYFSKSNLICKALLVLERICYYSTNKVLTILLEYALSENNKIKLQSQNSLKYLVTMKIDVIKNLGFQPQKISLETIKLMKDTDLVKNFVNILLIFEKLLSPIIECDVWNYNSVTISRSPIPDSQDIKEIRESTILLIQRLYDLVQITDQKEKLIECLMKATQTPSWQNYGDDLLNIILDDTDKVLSFFITITQSSTLEIIQKIESCTQWIYRRGLSKSIKDKALKVRDLINSSEEYQYYRILIGTRYLGESWDLDPNDHKKNELNIHRKITECAQSISAENFEQWRDRIISYASDLIKNNKSSSNFYIFLEQLGQSSPQLSFRLTKENNNSLGYFIIPLICGLYKSDYQIDTRKLIAEWVDLGINLLIITKLFESMKECDITLMMSIFQKSKNNNDVNTLNQIISTVSETYNETNKLDLKQLFLSTIQELSKHKNTSWVFNFCFRDKRKSILDDMSSTETDIILHNLLELKSIDFQAEEILVPIAISYPEKIINFFGQRFNVYNSLSNSDSYEAIPYEFYRLSEPLSKIPVQAVNIIRQWYSTYGLFIYEGGRLLKNIFPDFPKSFEDVLIKLIKDNTQDNIEICLAIIRNYKSDVIINVVYTLIQNISTDSKYLSEISAILLSTGLTTGESGIVNAYLNLKERISIWSEDTNENIKMFTSNFISVLDNAINQEKLRVNENIILRKKQFGE